MDWSSRRFQALLAIGRERDACIKLSGSYKFSQQPYPYEDTWPFIVALVEAFTLDRCVWGSDWPFLRAAERLDYGPLLAVLTALFPRPGRSASIAVADAGAAARVCRAAEDQSR